MSAAPITTRSQDAHPGGLSRTPPNRLDTSTKIAVSAARPTSQPARNATPVGLGRGVCNTSTAGMIDSGDSATTSASGMSSVNTEPQLPDIIGPFVASSLQNVASQEATPAPFAAVLVQQDGESLTDLPSNMLPG